MCLRCLDLSVNMFSCIPLGVFGLASSLEELSMSSNKITAWPDDVSQLGALSCLDVSWNRIENLPPSGIDSNGEWCDGQLVIMTHLTRLDISVCILSVTDPIALWHSNSCTWIYSVAMLTGLLLTIEVARCKCRFSRQSCLLGSLIAKSLMTAVQHSKGP